METTEPTLSWNSEARTVVQRRVGRPPVMESHGLSIEKIRDTYARVRSYHQTSRELGISVNTVRKYCNKPYPAGRHLQPRTWQTPPKPTGLYKWFNEHRAERIPRTLPALSKLTGATPNQIAWFLRRRMVAGVMYLKSLGDLRELPNYLVDLEGRRVPCGMLSLYELKIDRYDLTVQVRGMLRFGGAVKFVLPFEHYRKLFSKRSEEV